MIFSSCIVSKKKVWWYAAQKVKAEGELSDKQKTLITGIIVLKKLKQNSIDLIRIYKNGAKNWLKLNAEYEKLNANYKISLNKTET